MKRHYLLLICCFLFSSLLSAQNKNNITTKIKKGTISFATEDGNLKFGFGGRIYMDAATYFDDETDLSSGSEIRDIRMMMKASLWKNWNAKINISFAGGAVTLKDIYLSYKINKNSFVRAGNVLEPFGIEQTQGSRTMKFMHLASTIEAFRPGRRLGVSYTTWGKKYYWGAGLFGADANNNTEGDDGYGLTSRFVFTPIQIDGGLVQIGMSGLYRTSDAAGFDEDGNENIKSIRFRSRAATHIEGRRFIDANVEAAKSQAKLDFEVVVARGPVFLQSEYIDASVFRKSGNEDYHSKGWYAQLGCLVRGDDYQYDMKSGRLAKPGPGSVELLARYNETDLNDTDAAIMGGKQQDFTFGCTWFVNYNILMKLNFTNVDLDEYALNGEENFNMIQTRLQFSF